MKQRYILFCFLLVLLMFCACHHKVKKDTLVLTDSINVTGIEDSTIYGTCGEGTAMHTLELLTDTGDSISFVLNDEETEKPSIVLGGLLAGDKIAVISTTIAGEHIALKVVNISTLLGRWKSVDKDFSIEEGGTVSSAIISEKQNWNTWKIYNGNILLNKDTFAIVSLGADSLALENRAGIYVYKRIR